MVQASCFMDVPIGTHHYFPADGASPEEALIARHLSRWWDGLKPAHECVLDIEAVIAQSERMERFSFFFEGRHVQRVGENLWDVAVGHYDTIRITTPELLGWMSTFATL